MSSDTELSAISDLREQMQRLRHELAVAQKRIERLEHAAYVPIPHMECSER